MDTKQGAQTKKEFPMLERSVMLTRFKLSQQKRQLREKDNRLSLITEALKKHRSVPKSATKHKQASPQKSQNSNKVEKHSQDKKMEKFELLPNKLKRNKVTKKIMLKPKNELKVINWTSEVKRKRRGSQKNIKSPSVKRKRKKGKNSTSSIDSNYEDNRSQSPVYSELGFEEVIRIADERDLDDEDLMEILTCPSPVWWENPPDDEYIEGPIVIETNPIASMPNLITQRRGKHSRKRTPQKMIIESVECKVNDNVSIGADSLDTELLNSKTKSDVKFSKKRSKLESLLSTIKNKRNQLKDKRNNKILSEEIVKSDENVSEEPTKTDVDVTHTKCDTEEMPESIGDSSFFDISLLDNDGLKHLENIRIPIEVKNEKTIENKVKPTNETNIDNTIPLKSKTFPNEHFTISNNDKSKTIPGINNKKLKILNIKKVSPGMLTVKSPQIINNLQSNLQDTVKNETSLIKSGTSLDVNDVVKNSNEESNNSNSLLEIEVSSRELETNKDLSNNEIPLKDIKEEIITPNDDEVEYITVFEIINSDDEIKDESAKNSDAEAEVEIPVVTEDTSKEEFNKTKLNSYYKKCKNSRSTSKKTTKGADKKSYSGKRNAEKDKRLCDDCNIDTKMSIIVPSSNDIKYCLKCSSIFDADICSYCIKKDKEKQMESIEK